MKFFVYYDGKCGVCVKEINHYKKIAPPSIFTWVDFTAQMDFVVSRGLKSSDVVEELHVQDERGGVFRGVDAFLQIWAHIPRYRWVYFIARGAVIKRCLKFFYRAFVKWRLKRARHCQVWR